MGLLRNLLFSYPVLALIGALVGIGIFAYVFGRPQVGVITVSDTVLTSFSVEDIEQKLEYVRQRRDIRAVVIKLNSPGGSIAPSEELFLRVVDLKRNKPVVVTVGSLAASGAYMAASAANYIYVKPSSRVGNIGAILFLPPASRTPEEGIVATGPFKEEGGTERMYTNMLELAKESFAQMVVGQRSERLRLTKDELVQGRVYFGLQGVQNGLADAIGSDLDAVRKAAALARLRNYGVLDVNQEVASTQGGAFFYGSQRQPRDAPVYKTPGDVLKDSRYPHIFYLYVEPR